MSKEREKMLNNVIRKYGFEVRETINFAVVCEKSATDAQVKKVYDYLMK